MTDKSIIKREFLGKLKGDPMICRDDYDRLTCWHKEGADICDRCWPKHLKSLTGY